MENCGNISEMLELAQIKKETLYRSFEFAQSQANSILLFTYQWQDLEQHFDLTMKIIERQNQEIDRKKKLLDEQEREVRSKEDGLVLVQKRIEECNREVQSKENLCQKLITDCNGEIKLKEKVLGEVKRSIEEHRQELGKKEQEISSIQTLIKEYVEELATKEKTYDVVSKSINECQEELKIKKQELELTERLIKKQSEKFHLEETKLESLRHNVKQQNKEVELKEEKLNTVKEQVKKCSDELELKEREFGVLQLHIEERSQELLLKEKHLKSVKKSIEECNKEVQLKENDLKSVQKSIEECNKEIQVKEKELTSSRKSIGKCSEELELKKKQLVLIQSSAEALSEECESYELQLDLVRRMVIECLKELKGKQKEFDSQTKPVEERWRNLERKEREFEEHVKEFELKERDFVSAWKAAQDCSKIVACQSPGITDTAPGFGPQCGTTTECGSLMLPNDHDFLHNQVSVPLDLLPDPAKFVLDWIQKSCFAQWKMQDTGFNAGAIKDYILVLENLKKISPKISPQVKDEAMKLAVEWKSKMRAVTENSFEVLSFLQFLATFELVAPFNREEIVRLIWTIAQYKQAPEICRALGFADIAPDFVRNLTERKKYIEALRFIYAFKLKDIALSDAMIKKYLENCTRISSDMLKDQSIDGILTDLRILIECIEEYKIECSYSIEVIKEDIACLEMKKANWEHSGPAPRSMLQLKFTGKTPTNQPVPHIMFPPQHRGVNHNVGSSSPGEHLQLQYQNYKRPRPNPPTFGAYTPQVSAPANNCMISPGRLYGQGMVGSTGGPTKFHSAGNHFMVTANPTFMVPANPGAGQSNVAGQQNHSYFQNKHF